MEGGPNGKAGQHVDDTDWMFNLCSKKTMNAFGKTVGAMNNEVVLGSASPPKTPAKLIERRAGQQVNGKARVRDKK